MVILIIVESRRAGVGYDLDNFRLSKNWKTTIHCDRSNLQYADDRGKYRFGFNGAERLDAIYGEGNGYDLGARMYNPRLGKMFSTDPREAEYEWQSTYAYFKNSPINHIDYNGEGNEYDEQEDGSWKIRESTQNIDNQEIFAYYFINGDISFYNTHSGDMINIKSGDIEKKIAEFLNKQEKFNNKIEKTGNVLIAVGDGLSIIGYSAAPFTQGTSLSLAAVGEGLSKGGSLLEYYARVKREGLTTEIKTDITIDVAFELAPKPIETLIGKTELDIPAKKILKAEVNKVNLIIQNGVDIKHNER